MKRLAVSVLLIAFAIGMNSCEKCSTCTFKEADGTTITSDEVCQKGRAYKHSIQEYEDNGWTCSKN